MKKFVFITPERMTHQPNSDTPQPDFVDMDLIGFGNGGSIEAALKDLLELNEGLVEKDPGQTYFLDLKNESRQFFALKDYKNKTPMAS
jgi:hypothetical protein